MSAERKLINAMKILLEFTDMDALQGQSDALIGRAIELLAQPERDFIGEIQYLTDCLMEAEEKVSKLLAQPEQEQELRVSVWLPFKKSNTVLE